MIIYNILMLSARGPRTPLLSVFEGTNKNRIEQYPHTMENGWSMMVESGERSKGARSRLWRDLPRIFLKVAWV